MAVGLLLLGVPLFAVAIGKSEESEDNRGLRESLPDVRWVGLGTILIAALGFVVYDSLFLGKIADAPVCFRARFVVPGAGRIVRDCSITLIVFGSIILLSPIALKLEIPHFPSNRVWLAIAVVSAGPVVAAAVGVSVTETGVVGYPGDPLWYHRSNYNTSESVARYVDKMRGVTPSLSTPRTTGKVGQGPTLWDACGETDDFFDSLVNASPGDNDSLLQFNYTYSVPGTNPPFARNKDFKWQPTSMWNYLYQRGSVPACRRTVWDKDSVRKAQREKDLCQMKLSLVKECAPGWSLTLFQDYFCANFKECQTQFERATSSWKTFGAVNISQPDEPQRFELPVKWDRLGDFKRYVRRENDFEWSQRIRSDPLFWFVFHAGLLGIACSGWSLLMLGIIGLLTSRELPSAIAERSKTLLNSPGTPDEAL
jgi:hypothetical protein